MATKKIKIGLSNADKATMQAAVVALIKASLITPYSTSATYAVGDFVYYSGDGKIYKCTTAISTAEAWTSGHWTEATLNDVISAVNAAVASVDNKVDPDDIYPNLRVGFASFGDNLTPYSDESGAFQDNPMISQGTGTDNNSAIVTTGNYAQLREKQGNTLAVNQLVAIPSSSITTTKNGVTFTDNRDGTYTVNGTATGGDAVLSVAILLLNGGKRYFLTGNKQTNSNYLLVFISAGSIYATDNGGNAIYTPSSDAYMGVSIVVKENSTASNLKFEPKVVELKQMFNGNIPQDLLDHPDHFSWYYNGSLAYNAGSLENANGVKLVCTKRQLWDEQWELGGISSSTGANSTDNTVIRSKNYTRIIPNKPIHIAAPQYCYFRFYDADKNYIGYLDATGLKNKAKNDYFIAPSNAFYFKFVAENITSYANNITISLYYTPEEGGEGYDQHYPYEEPTVVDTGSEELLAFDTKDPDGTWHHNTGLKTFDGTENWTKAPTANVYYLTLNSTSFPYKWSTSVRAICAKYVYYGTVSSGYSTVLSNMEFLLYASTQSGLLTREIAFRNDSITSLEDWKTYLSNNNLSVIFETEPTTEQGTRFPENVEIDDYGMMYWLKANGELVGIPQGAKFFYPVNYKGFLDDLYNRTEGDAGNVVTQSELSASETARDATDAQLKAALGGTLRQLLAVSQSIDFADTDYVDLGNLNWNFDSSNSLFYISKPNYIADGSLAITSLSSLYKTILETAGANQPDMTIQIRSTIMYIRNTSYNDATAFKAAMKGVLLAYKKAE